MTRINVGISPKELKDKHLLAEHREIKRIPNAIKNGLADLNKKIPDEFCLGFGHVRFFYNKLLYLKYRYSALYTECVRRGFNVTNYQGAWDGMPSNLMNHYQPSEKDVLLIHGRLVNRNAYAGR